LTFNIRTDSNVDLMHQLLANSVTNRELRLSNSWSHLADQQTSHQLSSADSSFNLPVNASYSTCLALFSTQWEWLCLFTILCFSAGQALKTIYYFLNAKPNSNSTKNCLCTSDGFRCEKIVRFRQHSNSNSVTAL